MFGFTGKRPKINWKPSQNQSSIMENRNSTNLIVFSKKEMLGGPYTLIRTLHQETKRSTNTPAPRLNQLKIQLKGLSSQDLKYLPATAIASCRNKMILFLTRLQGFNCQVFFHHNARQVVFFGENNYRCLWDAPKSSLMFR